MKKTKRILSILLSCLMLMSMLSVGVFAATGAQNDPINANEKWFGYGVNCYLLNLSFAEGDTDGIWYELTIEQEGILYLEHKYKDVDYTITLAMDNGIVYEGGCVDSVIYNGPIMTLPVQVGDVATIQIVTKEAAAGTVYANLNIAAGTATDPIKVKSNGITVYVGAGQTVYFQDDTLNADYATKGLLVEGSVNESVFYAASVNSTSGAVTKTPFSDTDGDAIIEAKLGGSLGSAGAPPVKPMWAIENNSTMGIGTAYFLTIVDSAHECNWDDAQDADCNTCGAIREVTPACEHEYDDCEDTDCNLCGEVREPQHNLTHYEEVIPANCQEEGNSEFWYCSDCECYFGSADASYQVNPAWLYYTGDHVRPEDAIVCAVVPCELCGEDSYGETCDRGEAPVCQDAPCVNCGEIVYGWGCNYNTGDEEIPLPLCQPGDCIYCGTHYEKLYDCENGSWAPCSVDGECSYGCGKQYPATGEHQVDDSCAGGTCWLCWEEIEGAHRYDNAFDTNCSNCGEEREVPGVTFNGSSISEDVNGLAMKFDISVEGMALNGTKAIYDNATIGGYKLVGMGAVVWNDGSEEMYGVEDANDYNILNVPAVYLCNLQDGIASFAIRIIDIPEAGKDTLIRYRSYFIYEDENGEQHTVYGHSAAGAYNWHI